MANIIYAQGKPLPFPRHFFFRYNSMNFKVLHVYVSLVNYNITINNICKLFMLALTPFHPTFSY